MEINVYRIHPFHPLSEGDEVTGDHVALGTVSRLDGNFRLIKDGKVLLNESYWNEFMLSLNRLAGLVDFQAI